MLHMTAEGRVSHVLTSLGETLAAGDVERALTLFVDDCYWRDLIAFTWNIKTVEGKDAVRAMLEAQLPLAKPSAWTVDSAAGVSDEGGVTTGWFHFETDVARGYGLVRLKDGKIWTLLTTAAELKGHEEPLGFHRPLGAKHGAGKHRQSWKEEREEEARALAMRIAQNAPLSVRAGKRMVYAAAERLRSESFDEAERIFEPVYKSEDAQEGPRAFLEKRAPVWRKR